MPVSLTDSIPLSSAPHWWNNRVPVRHKAMSHLGTTMACDFFDGDIVAARVRFELTTDTAWDALTRNSGQPEASDCTINGGGANIQPNNGNNENIYCCNGGGQQVYCLWHTTSCCGGPATFSQTWDFHKIVTADVGCDSPRRPRLILFSPPEEKLRLLRGPVASLPTACHKDDEDFASCSPKVSDQRTQRRTAIRHRLSSHSPVLRSFPQG